VRSSCTCMTIRAYETLRQMQDRSRRRLGECSIGKSGSNMECAISFIRLEAVAKKKGVMDATAARSEDRDDVTCAVVTFSTIVSNMVPGASLRDGRVG